MTVPGGPGSWQPLENPPALAAARRAPVRVAPLAGAAPGEAGGGAELVADPKVIGDDYRRLDGPDRAKWTRRSMTGSLARPGKPSLR
ncbi:hypothetical protein HPP92_012383 [Vanilla planifolia]|uniref:Uncharacterized protein n=1 Tax=Vanilla planifolia TaxID=51239 RepID=A0A835V2P5_VANPL|nr:hypothetical protein HPP92_012383 [Vanilla planifolia]